MHTTSKTKNGCHAPQGLISGVPISQYASNLAMFCQLYSNRNKEQHENISAIHKAITEDT